MNHAQIDVAFISHGGGPLPLLGDPGHAALVAQLRELGSHLRRPSAIAVISAHWETRPVRIGAHPQPELIYDYYGFPEESYQLQYPAPGAPDLAAAIEQTLTQQGIRAQRDVERGLDHGVFVPLTLMYPEANIPVVPISLESSLDAEHHLKLGRALRQLDRNKLNGGSLLVLGSGFSYHNLREMRQTARHPEKNQAFQEWLIDTCCGVHTELERTTALTQWENAPHARYCHPREEHLLPLHVCYGLAGRAADAWFRAKVLGVDATSFLWEDV